MFCVLCVRRADAATVLSQDSGIVVGPFENRMAAELWIREQGTESVHDLLPLSPPTWHPSSDEACPYCGEPRRMAYPGGDPENGPARLRCQVASCPGSRPEEEPEPRIVELQGSARLAKALRLPPDLRRLVDALPMEARVEDRFEQSETDGPPAPPPAYVGCDVVAKSGAIVAFCPADGGEIGRNFAQETGWAIANASRIIRGASR